MIGFRNSRPLKFRRVVSSAALLIEEFSLALALEPRMD
jgi:hypothetical protein